MRSVSTSNTTSDESGQDIRLRVSPAAARQLATFHPEIIREVERALREHPLVVVGMAQNPHVRRVKQALRQHGLRFCDLEYGSYVSKWGERLAIKLWSGWPTFPQVFVRGVLIGGEDLTLQALADGSLNTLLVGHAQASVRADPGA